jgi:membrane-associated phospholipid phosphatase
MKKLSGCFDFLLKRRTLLLVLFLSLVGFLLVLTMRSKFVAIDSAINLYMASNQDTFLLPVALVLHNTFDTIAMFIITSAIVIFLYLDKLKKYSILVAAAMLGELIITTVAKAATHVPRPENAVITVSEFSFPSGHVMSTAILFSVLLYVIWKRWRYVPGKIILNIFLVLLGLSIGAGRLYLNVHWFSDVLGAYLLAALWFSFSILIFEFVQTKMETAEQKQIMRK